MTIIFAKVGLKTAMTERPTPEDSLEEGRKIKKQKLMKINNHSEQKLCLNLSFVRCAKY